MKKTGYILGLLLCVLLMAGSVSAYDLFVWVNDNPLPIDDPVLGERLNSSSAVMQTLDQLEIEYDHDEALPDDLSQYDVIMVLLGFSCPD